LFYR